MPLLNAEETGFAEAGTLSIFIYNMGSEWYHMGFIYALDDRRHKLCHLFWHHELIHEAAKCKIEGATLFWQGVALDEYNQHVIAATLHSLKSYKDKVSFGINTVSPAFTEEGKYKAQPIGKGMTCATFVSEIYLSLGFPLLKKESWPERDDDANWHREILTRLEEAGQISHMEAMRNDIGCLRFRAEEVTAATLLDDIPIEYSDCEVMASEIKGLLNR